MSDARAENERRVRELTTRDWHMLIGGEMVDAASGRRFDTINPSTGEVLASVPFAGADDVTAAVDAALVAAPEWRQRTVLERIPALVALSQKVQARAADLGLLDAVDSGNPVSAMVNDA
ncbi:MAG TPA: aldehyde dehydrogenase family protein, partial [Acidimicrobiales bacterium]|nr:aldehyde dehydrogenase family protein [Acidimicrobiales bacterium]